MNLTARWAGKRGTVAERKKNIREDLLMAGIAEINAHGVGGFSIRRVAEACGVSCAAPYKHFADKRAFIAAVIEYVNGQWRERQLEIMEECGNDIRRQIVAVTVGYIRFLMEKPYYRSILMLKDEEFDNIYHKMRGQMSSQSQQLEKEYFAMAGWDEQTQKRKLYTVRAILFGAVFMFDTGEMEYSDETMAMIEYTINREFDIA